jgi:hypothetical protein
MMPRKASSVALATCSEVAGRVQDDLRLIDALRERGIEAVHAAWDDASVDWSRFGLVVIRSTWDYPQRVDQFLTWLGRLPRVLNPAPIVRWNIDKHYLQDLAAAGLPVIPTRFLEPVDSFESPAAPFVVKPTVSCGAKDSARYDGDKAGARDHIFRIHASGRAVMVQPYLAGVERKGEVGLMFIGGTYSHSICRDALLLQSGLRDDDEPIPLGVRAYRPTPAERALAERVMSHIPRGSSQLLYGRVDLIPGHDGEPVILEVELFEPSLFLEFSEDGVRRLADAIGLALARKE